jgi:hypothetical protein
MIERTSLDHPLKDASTFGRYHVDRRALFPVFKQELLGMPILLFDIPHVARIEREANWCVFETRIEQSLSGFLEPTV